MIYKKLRAAVGGGEAGGRGGRMSSERVKELEKQIEELKSRWPAHSVPPTMLQELDELKEASCCGD